MKVMIGYDGSTHADAAIVDLASAGLTRDAEVLIVSVVKPQWLMPAVSELDLVSLATIRAEAVLSRGALLRQKVFGEASDLLARAAERLRWQFPAWRVSTDLLQGDPAEELLRKADEWRPDLIVVGSQGRSGIGRFFLGSVSKRIAEESRSSVRVVRGESDVKPDERLKIVAGARGLIDTERIVNAIGNRIWPEGTKVRLVVVDDGNSPGRVSALYPYAIEIFAQATEPLTDIGLQVSVDVVRGDPEAIFLQAADSLQTDAIFVAANSAITNAVTLDATARALVTSATSTVEIVR